MRFESRNEPIISARAAARPEFCPQRRPHAGKIRILAPPKILPPQQNPNKFGFVFGLFVSLHFKTQTTIAWHFNAAS
jgi:hypothetical protein